MYPTITEYSRVIRREREKSFQSLKNIQFIPSRTKPSLIYTYGSGSFAAVFKAKEDNGDEIAIRCFIGGRHDYVKRYIQISNYLKTINGSWITETVLLENEVSVSGKLYPVIKMEWVEGKLIDNYISENLNDNHILEFLQRKIVELSSSLEEEKIGHGDIQCGNVIIDNKNVIRLIDYDGLYIPDFKGQKSIEKGRPEFQHPDRANTAYNEKIDRFSFWVILCALEGLKNDKTLWSSAKNGGFNTGENILFTGGDFLDFRNSELVRKLRGFNNDRLNYYLNKLQEFCSSSPDSVDKPELFEGGKLDSFTEPEIAVGYDSEVIIAYSCPS